MPNNRFVVAKDQEFTYPKDAVSLKLVQDAGGVSKMSPENRARVAFKTVTAGQFCDDMPKSSLDVYLERGWVIDTKIQISKKEGNV